MEAESSGRALPGYAFLTGSCTSWQALADDHSGSWGCLVGRCGCPGGTYCLMTLFLTGGQRATSAMILCLSQGMLALPMWLTGTD